jgi:muconate cycloisomerase
VDLRNSDATTACTAAACSRGAIGATAHLQVFATLRELGWGCEHFGPKMLVDDVVTEPLRFGEFHVHVPSGPGIGVTLGDEKLRRHARR